MKTEELQKIAQEAAKNIKTEQDLAAFQQRLTKVTVEAALNAELDDHLGYERHEKSDGANHRNGFSSKTVQTEVGQFELNTPRDRNGDFEPKMVKKGQRRFTAMDDKILFLLDCVVLKIRQDKRVINQSVDLAASSTGFATR